MQHHTLTHELVQQRHADLHRQAAESRRAATAHPHPGADPPRPRRPTGRSTRRLGLLLMALGSRLAPVDPPASR